MDKPLGLVRRHLSHFLVAAGQFPFAPGDHGDDGTADLAFINLGFCCHDGPPYPSRVVYLRRYFLKA